MALRAWDLSFNVGVANPVGAIINVKDYGAEGDGVADDGPAIQAAFDAAFGTSASPNGTANSKLNKGVFFPAGTYLVGQQLFLNYIHGGWIFGAGQKATRLVYTGDDTQLPSGTSLTALLVARTLQYSYISGITFDVTDSNAAAGVNMVHYVAGNDGTGNVWNNCGFVGGSMFGFVCTWGGYGSLGSEELFLSCTFADCAQGARIHSGNALNYTFIGCRFQNCMHGLYTNNGSINVVKGCSFSGSSYASFTGVLSGTTLTVSGVTGTIEVGQHIVAVGVEADINIVSGSGTTWTINRAFSVSSRPMTSSGLDLYHKWNNPPVVVGCQSTSPNFVAAGGVWIAGCYHNPSVPGNIWRGGTDGTKAVIEGCLAGPNSGLIGSHTLYSRGNTFQNAGYLTNFAGTIEEDF